MQPCNSLTLSPLDNFVKHFTMLDVSHTGNLSGVGSDGYTVSWAFTGRSSFGDVYVIQIETPEGKQAPEAILYQGGEKVLYRAENGSTRIRLRPNSSH